jgi:hypothetical protein
VSHLVRAGAQEQLDPALDGLGVHVDQGGVRQTRGIDLADPEHRLSALVGDGSIDRPLEIVADVVHPHGADAGQALEVEGQDPVVAPGELQAHIARDTLGNLVAGEQRLSGDPVVAVRDDEIRAQNSVLRLLEFAICVNHAAHVPLHVGRQTAGLDKDLVEVEPKDPSCVLHQLVLGRFLHLALDP